MAIMMVILTALRKLSLTYSYTKTLRLLFSAASVMHHSYSNVEANLVPNVWFPLSSLCWSDVADDFTVDPWAAFTNLF